MFEFWSVRLNKKKKNIRVKKDNILHINQITLGQYTVRDGGHDARFILYATVNNGLRTPIGSLICDKMENLKIDLMFGENDKIVFEVDTKFKGLFEIYTSGYFQLAPEMEESDDESSFNDSDGRDMSDENNDDDNNNDDNNDDESDESEEEKKKPKKEKKSESKKKDKELKKKLKELRKKENAKKRKLDSSDSEFESAKKKKKETSKDYQQTRSGIVYKDKELGEGQKVRKGIKVSVRYTLMLKDGKIVDSNQPRGQPLDFKVGSPQLIKGFSSGIIGMKQGGARRIIIPPHLGYGNVSQPGIPRNSTLIFDVSIIKAFTN